MYELFIEHLEQIFCEGYAEYLAKEDPEKFNYELNDFLNLYNHDNF